MKLTINIEKKHLYLLVLTILLIAAVVFVFAYNPNYDINNVPRTNPPPSVMGHSVDEIDGLGAYINKLVDAKISSSGAGGTGTYAGYCVDKLSGGYLGSGMTSGAARTNCNSAISPATCVPSSVAAQTMCGCNSGWVLVSFDSVAIQTYSRYGYTESWVYYFCRKQ